MSNVPIVLKYIETRWHDKDTLVRLTESQYPLKIELNEDGLYEANTTIYPKVSDLNYSQLAINLGKDIENVTPYIIGPNNQKLPMKKIVDPVLEKIWWVETGEWNDEFKAWVTNTRRTAGNIEFQVGTQRLSLHIGFSEASKEDLEKYLTDFKSDMWELILDDNSYIQAEAKEGQVGGVDESTLRFINNILKCGKKLLQQPKSELREVQTLKPRKAVKPVPRTFMEISTRGNCKTLTSRDSEPNYNVAENRYALYVLLATSRIVSQLVQVSKSKSERFSNSLLKLEERLASLKDYKEINRDLVVKDYNRAKKSVDVNVINEKTLVELNIINGSNILTGNVGYISIQGKNRYNGFFCKIKNQEHEEWGNIRGYSSTAINIPERYKDLLIPYTDYYMQAEIDITSRGSVAILNPKYISLIKITGSPKWLTIRHEKIKDMEKEAISLKANNWLKPLSQSELVEQNKERKSINNRQRFFLEEQGKVSSIRENLTPKVKLYRDLCRSFTKLGIKANSHFPNSMSFVKNPNYQGLHANFKALKEQVGLTDEDILMSLEEVDSIGLVNVPLLYERWCLLQLIKSLTQNFRFDAEPGWKRKLLRIIEEKGNAEPIIFENKHTHRRVSLFYEPTLKNGRTPDFVLDIKSLTKNGNTISKRFVIDAKFYSDEFMHRQGGISGVVEHLAFNKNYAENGNNSVFIVHPTKAAIDASGGPVSPQEWAKKSHLGELKLFDWDDRVLPHQFGAVSVNPIDSYLYADEFQRMLGLFLQYESGMTVVSDDIECVNFCVGCGSSHVRVKPKPHYDKNHKKEWYQCDECDLFVVYNHCFKCGHRLIKNGEYWTYHSTMPMSHINIKCPCCENPL
ncbi:nuclease domain-containing protein [Aliivibrio fischeri]|uniref:nuclease domain-containing protein n=1 Tax=Aliivibrio fischeri TaxID=668 RepID=UPI0012DAE4BC|nr:nuclease domain-containing protein [Aliivibrio fischeri]MUK68986.1 EstP [Aliivibrio fischeri]MUK71979.1 EstP [Aliivibrio fischeri]